MPSKEKTPIHLVMIVDSGGCAHAQCHQTGDEAEQLGEHGCHLSLVPTVTTGTLSAVTSPAQVPIVTKTGSSSSPICVCLYFCLSLPRNLLVTKTESILLQRTLKQNKTLKCKEKFCSMIHQK